MDLDEDIRLRLIDAALKLAFNPNLSIDAHRNISYLLYSLLKIKEKRDKGSLTRLINAVLTLSYNPNLSIDAHKNIAHLFFKILDYKGHDLFLIKEDRFDDLVDEAIEFAYKTNLNPEAHAIVLLLLKKLLELPSLAQEKKDRVEQRITFFSGL